MLDQIEIAQLNKDVAAVKSLLHGFDIYDVYKVDKTNHFIIRGCDQYTARYYIHVNEKEKKFYIVPVSFNIEKCLIGIRYGMFKDMSVKKADSGEVANFIHGGDHIDRRYSGWAVRKLGKYNKKYSTQEGDRVYLSVENGLVYVKVAGHGKGFQHISSKMPVSNAGTMTLIDGRAFTMFQCTCGDMDGYTIVGSKGMGAGWFLTKEHGNWELTEISRVGGEIRNVKELMEVENGDKWHRVIKVSSR
jgi:hypothetical protein